MAVDSNNRRGHVVNQDARKDKLEWSEKVPLGLALAAQSYVLFNWYLATVDGIGYYVDFVVAIAAGIALDLIVVTTTMGRREGRESKWSHAAAFGAFFCSALIALKVYGAATWLPEGWLHIAFPLEVWLYSQHLATPRKQTANEQASIATSLAPSLPHLLPSLQESATDSIPTRDEVAQEQPVALEQGTVTTFATQEEEIHATLDKTGLVDNAILYKLLPHLREGTIRRWRGTWIAKQNREQEMVTSANGRH